MKLIIILAAITLVYADKLDRLYLPANKGRSPTHSHTHSHSAASSAGFAGFGARMDRPNISRDRNAKIIRQDFTNNVDSYSYSYETENGISAEEKGVATNGVQAQGSYSYTGDDGKVYAVWYTADENGFRPQGDHLPTPPPIPKEILKALEQNARDEAAGIFDDGSYRGQGQKQSQGSLSSRRSHSAQSSLSSHSPHSSHSSHSTHSSHTPHTKSSHSGYNRNAASIGNSYLPPLYVV